MDLPLCCAGRQMTRPSPYRGLDWESPCPVLPTEMLPFNPPLLFCTEHYDQVADELYEAYRQRGLLE